MTNAMLRLAKQVYPNRDWGVDRVDRRSVSSGCGNALVFFDPINNAEQFCDVQAWLLSRNFVISRCAVIGPPECDDFDHDGTASGIRTAVVQAAMSVKVCDGIR